MLAFACRIARGFRIAGSLFFALAGLWIFQNPQSCIKLTFHSEPLRRSLEV